MIKQIKIPPDLMQRIRKEARHEGKRVDQYIMDALRHYTDFPRIGRTMYYYNSETGRAEDLYVRVLYADWVEDGKPRSVIATYNLADDLPDWMETANCRELYPTPKEAEQAHAAEEARKAKEAEDYWRAWWANEKSKKRWPRDENGKLIKNPDGTFKKK